MITQSPLNGIHSHFSCRSCTSFLQSLWGPRDLCALALSALVAAAQSLNPQHPIHIHKVHKIFELGQIQITTLQWCGQQTFQKLFEDFSALNILKISSKFLYILKISKSLYKFDVKCIPLTIWSMLIMSAELIHWSHIHRSQIHLYLLLLMLISWPRDVHSNLFSVHVPIYMSTAPLPIYWHPQVWVSLFLHKILCKFQFKKSAKIFLSRNAERVTNIRNVNNCTKLFCW